MLGLSSLHPTNRKTRSFFPTRINTERNDIKSVARVSDAIVDELTKTIVGLKEVVSGLVTDIPVKETPAGGGGHDHGMGGMGGMM